MQLIQVFVAFVFAIHISKMNVTKVKRHAKTEIYEKNKLNVLFG